MLRSLGLVVKDFELYCYSCNCHPERTAALWQDDSDEIGRLTRLAKLLSQKRCCMMGRIAPNFAVGEWKHKFAAFAQRRVAQLLEHCCHLSTEEVFQITSEYTHGKSVLYMTMAVKLNCYDHLPHHALGIAHDDPEQAIHCATRCLQLFLLC